MRILLYGVLLVFLLTSCDFNSISFEQPPTITKNPNKNAPLTGIAVIKPAEVELDAVIFSISDGERSWKIIEDSRADGKYPLLGLSPGKEHQIEIDLLPNNAKRYHHKKTFSLTIPPISENPDQFPSLRTNSVKAELAEKGVTLFSVNSQTRDTSIQAMNTSATLGYLIVVNPAGEVLWYYKTTGTRISSFEVLPNDNILYLGTDDRLVEINWLGEEVKEWYAEQSPNAAASKGIGVSATALHNDIALLPSGQILTLGIENRAIPSYYTSDQVLYPRDTMQVAGDQLNLFNLKEGIINWNWSSFEELSTNRLGQGSFDGFWNRRSGLSLVDWTHANAITYQHPEKEFVLSLKNQSAIIGIDRKTRLINWIFGDARQWQWPLNQKLIRLNRVADGFWHPDAPIFLPNGNLLLFNSGNYQAPAFLRAKGLAETRSFAAEYEIDTLTRRATRVWTSQLEPAEQLIGIEGGDLAYLPGTGNILLTYSAVLDKFNLNEATWDWKQRSQLAQQGIIREVRHTVPAQLVWELRTHGKQINWQLGEAKRMDWVHGNN